MISGFGCRITFFGFVGGLVIFFEYLSSCRPSQFWCILWADHGPSAMAHGTGLREKWSQASGRTWFHGTEGDLAEGDDMG